MGQTSSLGTVRAPCALAGACAFVVTLFSANVAVAQENRSSETRTQDIGHATDAATSSPGPGTPTPGFFDALGRWLEEGTAKLKSEMQSAQERMDKLGSQARESTKEATGAVAALPNSRIVIAREQCAVAPNGAPDCQSAALTLCRGKGFATGKSLDTQTEQKCKSGRFLLEGRAPSSADCPTNIFVTRAMCQ